MCGLLVFSLAITPSSFRRVSAVNWTFKRGGLPVVRGGPARPPLAGAVFAVVRGCFVWGICKLRFLELDGLL